MSNHKARDKRVEKCRVAQLKARGVHRLNARVQIFGGEFAPASGSPSADKVAVSLADGFISPNRISKMAFLAPVRGYQRLQDGRYVLLQPGESQRLTVEQYGHGKAETVSQMHRFAPIILTDADVIGLCPDAYTAALHLLVLRPR